MELILIFLVVAVACVFAYRRFFGRKIVDQPASQGEAVSWPNRGEFDCEIVGESHYQDNIARVIEVHSKQEGDFPLFALLTPESTNNHDRNAVRVTIGGAHVGYLSREFAPIYRQRLVSEGLGLKAVYCQATITGGFKLDDGERASFGVMLDIEPHDGIQEN